MLSACLFGLCPDRSSMAYYGIPSAAASLTATNSDDTISILGRSTTLTAQSVYGANGNDVISLAAVGKTAVASSTISVVSGIALSGGAKFTVKDIVTLVGASATTTLTGILTASAAVSTSLGVSLTGVLTSQQATRKSIFSTKYHLLNSLSLVGRGFLMRN